LQSNGGALERSEAEGEALRRGKHCEIRLFVALGYPDDKEKILRAAKAYTHHFEGNSQLV